MVGVPADVQKEPVAFIRLAQEKWEGKLKQAINKLCTTYKVSLSRQVCILTETGRRGGKGEVWFVCLETSPGKGNSKEKMELCWSRLSRCRLLFFLIMPTQHLSQICAPIIPYTAPRTSWVWSCELRTPATPPTPSLPLTPLRGKHQVCIGEGGVLVTGRVCFQREC